MRTLPGLPPPLWAFWFPSTSGFVFAECGEKPAAGLARRSGANGPGPGACPQPGGGRPAAPSLPSPGGHPAFNLLRAKSTGRGGPHGDVPTHSPVCGRESLYILNGWQRGMNLVESTRGACRERNLAGVRRGDFSEHQGCQGRRLKQRSKRSPKPRFQATSPGDPQPFPRKSPRTPRCRWPGTRRAASRGAGAQWLVPQR